MIVQMKDVKSMVHYILTNVFETRDCDASLYLAYLYHFTDLKEKIGEDNCIALLDVMTNTSPPETIRRVRQKIQEQGYCHGERRAKRLEMGLQMKEDIHTL